MDMSGRKWIELTRSTIYRANNLGPVRTGLLIASPVVSRRASFL
jgi:hypothetical protein